MTTMQIDRAVVEQALEALEWHYRQGHSNTLGGLRLKIDEKALRNLRAALAQQAEPVSADPHTTTLRNLLECCLSWERDACVLGTVTARQAVTALRAALAQQAEPVEPVATVAENATTQQRVVETPPSDYRRGYWDGFNIGKREGRIEAEDALAQQAEAVEPVATVAARQYDDGTYAGNALDWAGRNCEDDFPVGTKLYTAPPPPQRPAESVPEPYTDDVTRLMRDAGMTFHLGLPHKAVVEQMTRVVDLVYAEASIKAAQQFATPPQRKPLTKEEIERIGMTHQSLRQVVRAAEKASWEKNHG